MKNKLILTLMLTMFCYAANAQTHSKKLTFGLRIGIDYQNFIGKEFFGNALDHNRVPRFNTGFIIGVPVSHNFQLQTGLLYSTKGSKTDQPIKQDSGFDHYNAMEYNLTYLELPVNLIYKPALGNGHLLLGFGPYVGYAIGGNVKYFYPNRNEIAPIGPREFEIEFSKYYNYPYLYANTHFNRFDYGGNLLLGYELPIGLSIQINAQLGMAQINSQNLYNKISYKNSGFGLSIGYNF